jgi:hypothetical protein
VTSKRPGWNWRRSGQDLGGRNPIPM